MFLKDSYLIWAFLKLFLITYQWRELLRGHVKEWGCCHWCSDIQYFFLNCHVQRKNSTFSWHWWRNYYYIMFSNISLGLMSVRSWILSTVLSDRRYNPKHSRPQLTYKFTHNTLQLRVSEELNSCVMTNTTFWDNDRFLHSGMVFWNIWGG